MSWFQCNDPLVKTVREVYRANVVSAPRAGLLPLEVIAQRENQFDLRGDLAPLIHGEPTLDLPPITSAPAASLTGKRTSNIKVGLAADLTAKFLTALGIPIPSASLEATLFQGGNKVSFEVLEVRERAVDIGELGRRLLGRRIDPENPAVSEIFFGPNPARMLIISRALQSPSFGVTLEDVKESEVEIQVNAVKELFGEASADLSWKLTQQRGVTFKGVRPATFAFSAIRCHLKPDGKFALGMEVEARLLEPSSADDEMMLLPLDEPIVNQDGLIEFSDDPPLAQWVS